MGHTTDDQEPDENGDDASKASLKGWLAFVYQADLLAKYVKAL